MAGIVHVKPKRLFHSGCRRGGLTTLEFAGCVVAVLGGAWIGAIYLGVDLRHVAHAALDEAELLDDLPPEWRPPGPKEKGVTREQLVSTLRKELGSLRSEIVALRAVDGTGRLDGSITDLAAAAKERSLAYWTRLSQIALGETALQHDAETAFNESNAAKVFAIKGRISRFAANAVDAVPTDGVDPTVVQFGRQLGQWYQQAGELYERAVQIWELPASNQARTQLNKEWRTAELHHRNQARLLEERAAAVRSTISRQFAEEFPEFAKPVTAAANSETQAAAG